MERNERMYQELLDLITIDIESGRENAMAEAMIRKLEELGFTVTTDHAGDIFGGSCGNVLGVREGELDGALLLCSHMDRVPNGLGIKPVEKDGVLYSDGTTILAADDVSGLCAILEGVREALASGRPLPRLEVLFTVGEEVGLYGATAFDISQAQARMGYIFDSPGSIGRVINGAPGRYCLGAKITGLAAHAGNEPEKGIDAAKIMCDMLSTLKMGRLDEITTSNFPVLKTGSKAVNVVCDYAEFSGEVRSRDGERLLNYVKYFEDHCKEVAEKNGATIEIIKDESFFPFRIPEDALVSQVASEACAKLGIDCRFESGGGGMDGNIFNAKGFQILGVATGYTKNHTKNEQLVLDDFFQSGRLAAELIYAYGEHCK